MLELYNQLKNDLYNYINGVERDLEKELKEFIENNIDKIFDKNKKYHIFYGNHNSDGTFTLHLCTYNNDFLTPDFEEFDGIEEIRDISCKILDYDIEFKLCKGSTNRLLIFTNNEKELRRFCKDVNIK